MENVYTHKALSNKVYLLGYVPSDIAAVLITSLMVWGITNSFKVAFGLYVVLCYLGKKIKHRPEGYFKSLFMFLSVPRNLSVKEDDIPCYKEMLCKK